MSRLLSYCFVALAVEVLWAASAFGGDPSGGGGNEKQARCRTAGSRQAGCCQV